MKTIVTALLIGGLALCCRIGIAQETHELILHHFMPPLAPAHHKMLVPWGEKVERESNGRLKIHIYPSMQLGGQSQALIDQARDGVVDIIWTASSYTAGRFPRVEVFELPYMQTNPKVMNLALTEFLENHPEEFGEYKIIASFVHAGQLLHSYKRINNADDLVGMKIRMPTRVSGWAVEAMGGIPIGAPGPKVPEMLTKGLVNAALVPFEASGGMRLHEIIDYHVFIGTPPYRRMDTTVFVIAMNWDSYNALPDDLKTVIDANSGYNIDRWLGQVWLDAEEPGLTRARESGEVYELPLPELEKLRRRIEEPVRERWLRTVAARGIDGEPLIEEARLLIKKYEEEIARESAQAAAGAGN